MQRTFILNLALIILLNLIIKPFYIFGIDAEVQNQVGTAEYGLYFSLLNLTFLFNIILDFGIANYTSKTIAQHPNLVSSYFSKLLSIKFLLFGLYIITIVVTSLLLGYEGLSLKILGILVFNQFLVATIQFVRANLNGLHRFKSEAILSGLDRTGLIILCSLLLWTDIFPAKFTVLSFVLAQLIAYGFTAIISILMMFNFIRPLKIEFNKLYTISLLKSSAPYAILIFLMFLYNRIDAIMLERMLPDGKLQAGIYAQGFRYLDAVNMIALLFAGLLLPIFARLLKEKKPVYNMVLTPVNLLIPGAILIGIVGYANAETIMNWRYVADTSASALPFSILIISFIPISFTYIFGTLLTANGNLKALNYMAIFGFIFNLSLNLILIPNMKAEGAAIATLLTQSITALIQIVIAYRLFRFKIDYALMAKIGLFTAVIILINSNMIKNLKSLKSVDNNLLLFFTFATGVLLIVVFKFIKISDFKSLFSSTAQKAD